MLSAAELQAALPIQGLGHPFYFFKRVDSTNERAVILAQSGSPHGTLVVAEEQTAGRGRAGRRWHTPPGGALALSLILRPAEDAGDRWQGLPILGALAVVEATRALGAPAEIKWPNDVLIRGRKVAGILMENTFVGEALSAVVLGIGVNVHETSLPPWSSLDYPATCMETELGREVPRAALLMAIIAGVGSLYPSLGEASLVERWNERLAFREGRVDLSGPHFEITGVVKGVGFDGRLHLLRDDGSLEKMGAGEIRLRPVDTI